MKFPICLFFTTLCFSLALGLISHEAYQTLRSNQKHCIQLSGVQTEHLKMVRLHRKIYKDEYLEKFAVCMLKKLNIMNVDGSINKHRESYILLTDNPQSFNAAHGCVALATGTYVRESARKIMTCLLKTDIIVMVP